MEFIVVEYLQPFIQHRFICFIFIFNREFIFIPHQSFNFNLSPANSTFILLPKDTLIARTR